LDISKAFDSVGWAYLIEVMSAIGFGQLWRDWVCLSLASATSRVLLNGEPGDPFSHARGLRQGDPLSPMLFILAIDPLQRLLELATQSGILAPIRSRATRCRISLYADDAGIFVNPLKEELQVITAILDCFGKASGLVTNMSKTEVFPVRCDDIDLPDLLSAFPATLCLVFSFSFFTDLTQQLDYRSSLYFHYKDISVDQGFDVLLAQAQYRSP
jgi:hypothetical protein